MTSTIDTTATVVTDKRPSKPLLTKSLAANSLAIITTAIGYYFTYVQPATHSTVNWWPGVLFSAGLFAVSGGITNWLAIHMLFERVPGLYGSGVIPNNFNAFKTAIREMMLAQFFTPEKLQAMAAEKLPGKDAIMHRIDLDMVFDALLVSVKQSSLGGMLEMVGGVKALEPMRDGVKNRLRIIIDDVLDGLEDERDAAIAQLPNNITALIDRRLSELTPQLVKELVQDMIHQHLGWLVVWGVVFGGLIGVVAASLSV